MVSLRTFGLSTLDMGIGTLHGILILFVGLGWALPSIQPWHLGFLLLVLAMWVLTAKVTGVSSCPLTLIQWRVKELKGEVPPGESFFNYYFQRWGFRFHPETVDRRVTQFTLGAFALSLVTTFLVAI